MKNISKLLKIMRKALDIDWVQQTQNYEKSPGYRLGTTNPSSIFIMKVSLKTSKKISTEKIKTSIKIWKFPKAC
jgi:hypothetical protein